VFYEAQNAWTANPVNGTMTKEYNYPANWLNRNSVTENGAVTGYAANAMNQYTSVNGVEIQYDGNFNLNYWGGAIVNYDAQNQLLYLNNGNSAQFTYDGLGRCVKRTINGVTTLLTYDGWKPILEWDGAGNFAAWNIYGAGADEILWRYSGPSGYLRYHHDRHGNVMTILNGDGAVVEKYSYDAFGQPTILSTNNTQLSASAVGNRFMFQGREYFPELGIYDYRHRFYHPAIGRFLQSDPTGFDAGDMNLFRYCDDDPIDKSDPTGLYETPAGGWENFSGGKPASYYMDVYHGRIQNQPAGNLTFALVPKDEGGGLMPLPPPLLRKMYAAHLQNVEEATNPAHWDTFPGTTKIRKNEYATAVYQRKNGFELSKPEKGYWSNGPKSAVPGGVGRIAGVHVHVTGDGRHLIWDRDQAINNHYISGVGSIFAPRRLDIFVPSQSKGPGAYFHTDDGESLIPGH
jgi:RHS repeat-associated protein